MVEASREASALASALSALLSSPPDQLAKSARAVSRAADDAEIAAAETVDVAARRALMEQVDAARGAATAAREQAKRVALEKGRDKLLGTDTEKENKNGSSKGAAADIAKDINDGLRRITAVVKEEVDRSRAAGEVVEESGRRLRMTRDRHGTYGEGLSSGASTLGDLKRTELVANVIVAAGVLFFSIVAAYVVNKKLSNSNTATFLVRPAMKVVLAPVRLVSRFFR